MFDRPKRRTMRTSADRRDRKGPSMTIERLDPPGLAPLPGAANLTIATGSRIIQIAGQTGVDASGAAVGPGHGEQAARAVRNLAMATAAAAASLADVARLTIYLVGYTPEVFEVIVGAVVTELGEDYPITAATLVGVAALWQPGLVIEIDATIVA